jgi:hypothetical protein
MHCERPKKRPRLAGRLQPKRDRDRVALTTIGVAKVVVADRFTEQILDLHWGAILDGVLNQTDATLREFAGLEVDGFRLVASRAEFVGSCIRWADR